MMDWKKSIEDIVMVYVLVLAALLIIGGGILIFSTCFCSSIIIIAGVFIIWAALRQQFWLKPAPDPKFLPYYPYTNHQPYLPPDKYEIYRMFIKRFYRKLNIPPVRVLLPVFLVAILIGSLILLTIETQFGVFAWVPFIFVFIIAFSFPSLIWISLVYNEDAFTPEPARNIMIVLTWGMLSVILALIGNTFFGVFFTVIGFSAAAVGFIVATFSAPFVEEFSKPLGLWLVRFDINTRLDGLIYGVTAGMGFAMIENLSYEIGVLIAPFTDVNLQTGIFDSALEASSAFALITLARGLGSTIVHAIGAGMIGMAFFDYRTKPGKPILPLAGAYSLAVIFHMLWNGVLSTVELYELPDIVAYVFMVGFPLLMLFILLQLIKICKSQEPELEEEPEVIRKSILEFELPAPPVSYYPYAQPAAPGYPQQPYYGYPGYIPPPAYIPPPQAPPGMPYWYGAPPPPPPPPDRKEKEEREVRCPRCDKVARIPPMRYGKDMICPHCGMLYQHPY